MMIHHMAQPLVKSYLETHCIAELAAEHGVFVRFSSDYRKFSLNYDQICAKSGDPVAESCRGLILGTSDDLQDKLIRLHTPGKKIEESPAGGLLMTDCHVKAWPFTRFYNFGDTSAAKIDWNCRVISIEEKLDGTLIIIYHDENEWCIATRGVPDADTDVNGQNFTFADLTKKTILEQLGMTFESMVEKFNQSYTYMFELCTPENSIVVPHVDYTLTSLGIRNRVSGLEVRRGTNEYDNLLGKQEFKFPITWNVASEPDVIVEMINTLSPKEFEGAVIVDLNFNRVKIKSLAYTLSHRIRDNVSSPRNMVRAVISENADDILATLDGKLKDEFIRIWDGMRIICSEIDGAYKAIKSFAVDRRDFAGKVALSGLWPTPFFVLYDNKADSTLSWLRNLTKNNKLSDSLVDLIISRINNDK